MLSGVDVKTVLKRGALVAAANWQVTVVQFMAESTFKLMLSVPIIGGILLLVLVLGRELPELFSPDIRESLTFLASALAAEPPALISFLGAFAIVGLSGSVLMFIVKGGTVSVLAEGEREAEAVEAPPLRLKTVLTAARFTIDGFEAGCARFMRRFLRLGAVLIAVYVVAGSAYVAVLLAWAEPLRQGNLDWTARAGFLSVALAAAATLLNFFYLLLQMVVVVDDCSVRSAARRMVAFVRAEPRLTFGVFGVVLLLVIGATVVSLIATTSLGLIAFVPLVGIAVVPLELLAWLFRELVFQYLGLSALAAYIALYRRHSAGRGQTAP